MIHTSRLLLSAALAVVLAASSASAQVLFKDYFDQQPDNKTASVWEGDTAEPVVGDADPIAEIGTWGRKSEKYVWYGQVSTATNGPTTGPAGGTGKYLTLMRDNDNPSTDFRADLTTPAAGKLSIDFQIAFGITTPSVGTGALQFCVRNATNQSGDVFSGTPFYINIDPDGTINPNSASGDPPISLTFDPSGKQYNSFNVLVDVPAQTYSIKVNGTSAADATNLPFSLSVADIRELEFYCQDTGVFGIDNVVATSPVNADFNGNGVVDAADYVLWRKNNGITSGATQNQGDANGDGAVNSNDYDLWRGTFGLPSGSGSSLSAGGSVPEPSSAALLGLGSVAFALLGRRATRP